ncbi:MAG: winged helix-turn-helix domain-containing protein [Euryarchaeota archaeon]|nr:winged helix-turn-helix domain-containing protein [Euryarchaeota archaeon]
MNIPFEGIFGSTPELKTLQFLIAHTHFDYTKKELAEHSGISRQTVYKVLDVFLKWEIIKETRKIGNVTLYTLNTTNKLVTSFKKFDNEIINIITQEELRKTGHPEKQRIINPLLFSTKKQAKTTT